MSMRQEPGADYCQSIPHASNEAAKKDFFISFQTSLLLTNQAWGRDTFMWPESPSSLEFPEDTRAR